MRHIPGFIPFLTVSLLCSELVQCLQCYSCTASPKVGSLCDATVACASGEVCSNVVYKRYTLSTVYTKGCMRKSTCQALQNLNSDDTCELTPSECTYCCYNDTCNQGTRTETQPATLAFYCLITTVAVVWAST